MRVHYFCSKFQLSNFQSSKCLFIYIYICSIKSCEGRPSKSLEQIWKQPGRKNSRFGTLPFPLEHGSYNPSQGRRRPYYTKVKQQQTRATVNWVVVGVSVRRSIYVLSSLDCVLCACCECAPRDHSLCLCALWIADITRPKHHSLTYQQSALITTTTNRWDVCIFGAVLSRPRHRS